MNYIFILYIDKKYKNKTSIVLNDEIINESVELTGLKNKTEIINKALFEYNCSLEIQNLIQMAKSKIIDSSFNVEKYRGLCRKQTISFIPKKTLLFNKE